MVARAGRKLKSKKRDRGAVSRERRTGKSKFRYKARTEDQIKKREQQSGGNFDSPIKPGFDMWRPKAGENVIRILPPTWEDFDHYGYEVFMHRFIGSDSSNYICRNKMLGKKCAACDEAKALKDDGEDDDAKEMGYQKRVWVWIIDRDDKTETPQVWDMSWTQDRDIASQSHPKAGKVLLIDHPDDGYDVIVKRMGQGMKTKYSISVDRDPSPISDDPDKQDEILEFITENPIPDVLNVFSNEHIEKKLSGKTEEKDEELDEDEEDEEGSSRKKPKGKKGKAPRRREREEEDEEEDEEDESEEDEEDEEEDEEEETSSRRSKKPKRRVREEAEDEEEDEEDEEEEEKPARRSKTKPKKRAKAEEEDEEEEDEEDEDEEEEKPRRRRR